MAMFPFASPLSTTSFLISAFTRRDRKNFLLRGRGEGFYVYEDPSAPSEYFPFNRTYYYEYGAHGNGSILILVENTEQAKAVINRTISYRHWQGESSWWDQREAIVRRVKEYFGSIQARQ